MTNENKQPLERELSASELGAFAQSYRDAMAMLGGAVNIITSAGAGGRVGFAATAVCSVSDNPPKLLVCANRSGSSYLPILENRVLCVNTLATEHQELAAVFGGQRGKIQDRFAHGKWIEGPSGSPILANALASFDCRLLTAHESGTHDIFVCEVIESRIANAGEGLFYYKRQYRSFETTQL